MDAQGYAAQGPAAAVAFASSHGPRKYCAELLHVTHSSGDRHCCCEALLLLQRPLLLLSWHMSASVKLST
jgi:hypothetical protein